MDTVNKKRQTDEIRRCAKDPIYFFNTYVRVSHPTKGPLPFKTYPFQDECVKAFIEHRFVIINKSRQLGLSTLAAAYAAWLLIFHRNKEVIIMATKLKIAMNFIRKVKFCVQNLPKWLVLPKIAEDNKQSLVFGFPSNSRIEAIPTAPDAGRSEALSLLIVDEAAHVSAFEELWKGLYPTLSCVAGDTKVLLSDGFYEIDELCSGRAIGDYFELTNNVYGKHGLEPLSHGYVSPESETLKIKTRHGIELEVTKKHPLWALNAKDGGSMVQAQNLKIGDHLRVQHSMNVYGNDTTIDHHLVKEMTTELAYLLGGFIAEGWITRSSDGKGYAVYVSNSDAEFRDAFLNSSIIKKFHAQKNTQKLICCSRDLVTLFEAVGIDPLWKCDTKRVPKKIWRCPKEIQAAFLRGYFDGDGSATRGTPCASSTSRKLIADIHQLLLNVGIIPKIIASDLEKAKKQIGVRIIADNKKPLQSVRQSWGIHVPRSQAKLFLDKIGFAIKRKQEKLSSYVSMFECDDRKQHKIPLTKEILERIEVIVNESSHAKSWFRANGCRLPEKGFCELSTKKKYRENVRYTSVETIRRFRDFLFKNNIASEYSIKFLDEISGGDYYWDSIVSITESRAKTYDFTVPGTHSFLQNCILGSNTGGRAMIISTPNGVGNWFHKLWTDSQDKSNEFFSIELPWQVHPERNEEWFTNECKNMSQKAISQELLCVGGETRIITKGGFKLAKNITVDDYVLTHKGRFMPVVKTHSRQVDPTIEPVFSISTAGNRKTKIIMTGNHPILAQRLRSPGSVRTVEWLQADQTRLDLSFQSISELDAYNKLNAKNRTVVALYPRCASAGAPKQKQLDLLKLHDAAELLDDKTVRYNRQWGSNQRFVDVNYDLGRFVGLWMADGYSNPAGRFGFGFSFHRDEYDTLLAFINSYLLKHGARTRPSVMKTSNACRIESHNQFFVKILKLYTGGNYANDKILHWDNVIDAGIEFCRGLLVGYFQGDGTHKPDKKLTVVSCNQKLLYQIRTLLTMFGHYPRIGHWNNNPSYLEIDNVRKQTIDEVILNTKENIELPTSRTRLTKNYVIGNQKFSRILNSDGLIDVYNFEVLNDHTYVADSIVVHNCDFLSSGDTYLDASDIDWVGKSIKPPLRRAGPDNNVWIWEEPIVDPDIKYIIPADVGRGDGNDFSTFHILCVQTGQVIAEYRGKIRPDLFAKLLLEYGKKYNNALICPEKNTYGHHVIIELVNNGYTNIYFRNRKNVYIGSYIPQDKISDAGFDTQKESRKQIVAKLEEVIRNKQIKVYSSRLYNELKTFVTHGDKPQAQKNCHDDLVMALAIGVWLFDASEVNSQFAQSLNKAMLSGFSMNSNSFDNLAGNGNEVLPSWIGMIPYMGGPAAPVNQKRLRPGPDSITNIDWLLKK